MSGEAAPPKWADLFGLDPDFTGEACSVDYVRWGRGADKPDEFIHEACWVFQRRADGLMTDPALCADGCGTLATRERPYADNRGTELVCDNCGGGK